MAESIFKGKLVDVLREIKKYLKEFRQYLSVSFVVILRTASKFHKKIILDLKDMHKVCNYNLG